MSYKFHKDSFGLLAFLGVVTAMSAMSTDMGLPSFVDMEASFKVPEGSGALTLTTFMAGYAISPLICGPLADRFGRRPILAVGVVIFSVCSFLVAGAPNYSILLAYRCVQGLGAGLSVTLPMAIVRDLISDADKFRSYQGKVNLFWFLSPMVAPSLGALITAVIGWWGVYIVQGAVGIAIILAAIFFFEETLPRERRQSLNPGNVVKNYAKVLKNPIFIGANIMYMSSTGALFTYFASSTLILIQHYGLPGGGYAALIMVHAVGCIIGSVICTFLSGKGVSSRVQLGLGVFARLFVVFLLYAATAFSFIGPYLIVGLNGVISVTLGLTAPNSIHEALRTLPDVAGSASGMVRALQMAAAGLASLIVSLLAMGRPEHGVRVMNVGLLGWALFAVGGFFFWMFACGREARRETEAASGALPKSPAS